MRSRFISARGACRAGRSLITSSVCACCLLIASHAGAADGAPASQAQPLPGFATVLEAWLAFPGLAQSDAPYVYLRAIETANSAQIKRDDLTRELNDLRWRLEAGGYPRFVQAVDQWKQALAAITVFREPGDWSAAWLMANPNRNPPISHVAAIGTCNTPNWVEIWSGDGVTRTPWHTGMSLSNLAKRGVMDRSGVEALSVVSPDGQVQRFGQSAYNYSDKELLPGARVVLPLPLGGEAFAWIRDSTAQFLAHAPSGENCTEMKFAHQGSSQ